MIILEALKFDNLYERLLELQIPIMVAYKLARIKDSLKSDIGFYQTSLLNILNKYALKDADGNFIQEENSIKLEPDKIVQCQKELKELESISINKDDSITFSIDELSQLSLTLTDMETLLPFIK